MQASYEPPPLPSFSASSDAPASWKGGLLALGLWEGDLAVEGESVTVSNSKVSDLDGALGGVLAEVLEGGEFRAKKVRHQPLQGADRSSSKAVIAGIPREHGILTAQCTTTCGCCSLHDVCQRSHRRTVTSFVDQTTCNDFGKQFCDLQGSSAMVRLGGNARHIAFIGLGKQEDASPDASASRASSPGNAHWGASAMKAAGMAAAKECKACKAKELAFAVPGGGDISAEVRPCYAWITASLFNRKRDGAVTGLPHLPHDALVSHHHLARPTHHHCCKRIPPGTEGT